MTREERHPLLALVYAMQSSCAGVMLASPSAALTSANICSCGRIAPSIFAFACFHLVVHVCGGQKMASTTVPDGVAPSRGAGNPCPGGVMYLQRCFEGNDRDETLGKH